LIDFVKSTNTALGNDPLGLEAPWDLISDKMGGKRTVTQCRVKWSAALSYLQYPEGKLMMRNQERSITTC
jgi:hypothetical protein